MAKAKRVRWECPNGLHPGVLASTRPARNATARFCLPCSEEAGVLVERSAPALERRRSQKTVARQTKAERERERAREEKANALKVTVIDKAGEEVVLDAGELLKEAWRSKVLRGQQREAWPGRNYGPLPELVIRRGAPDRGRPASRADRGMNPRSLWIRRRDALSGHAEYGGGRIVLTVRPGLGEEWLRGVIVHEAAHAACPMDVRHGPSWRSAYWRATAELYGLPLATVKLDGQPSWLLDEQIALALYEREGA